MANYFDNWWEEKRAAYLYEVMATSESNILHQKLFTDLQQAAETQAKLWEKKLLLEQPSLPRFQPDLRTRIVAWLIKQIGADKIHNILCAMKIRGMALFRNYHNEHSHTTINASSNLRAAVFGINDGLVSNASLILGVAGSHASLHFLIVAGIAGLLAGACSMGAGEYISVKSQREVFEYQIAIEREELREYPEEETEELSLIYQARGVPKEDADHLAKLLIKNPETGLNILAREELGLNPEDLVSPTGAMFASFVAFALGAAVPLVPLFFFSYPTSIIVSIMSTGAVLFLIGMIISLFTNRPALLSGLRMLLIGLTAGLITYAIGNILGVAS